MTKKIRLIYNVSDTNKETVDMYKYKGKEVNFKIDIYPDVVPYLGGVGMKDFITDKVKCADAWEKAKERFYAEFGESLPIYKVAPHPIAYMHLVALGAKLEMRDGGEPNIRPFASDIDEAIGILKSRENFDYASMKEANALLELCEYLGKRFPDEGVSKFAGFGHEGPVTTAVLMRGSDFYCDIYEEPEKCKELLQLIAESSGRHANFVRLTSGGKINDYAYSICDDFAALLPPDMMSEFVFPYWYVFGDTTTLDKPTRFFLHCEGVTARHLDTFHEAHINHFQPSVSPALVLSDMTPRIGTAYNEFDWLCYAFNVVNMSDNEIENFIEDSLEAGACNVRTQIGSYAFECGKTDRIKAWIRATEKYKV